MSIFTFIYDIRTIWQQNDTTIAGDNWIRLQDIFKEQFILQYKNKSGRFKDEIIEYVFLPEESVAMRHRLAEFLEEIFVIKNAINYFDFDLVDSRLRVSIRKQNFTTLIAAAAFKIEKPVINQPSTINKIETRGLSKTTSATLKPTKKRQREEEKEECINAFLLHRYSRDNRKRKTNRIVFRCQLNDFLSENQSKIYFDQATLDELIGRLYKVPLTEKEFYFEPIHQI